MQFLCHTRTKRLRPVQFLPFAWKSGLAAMEYQPTVVNRRSFSGNFYPYQWGITPRGFFRITTSAVDELDSLDSVETWRRSGPPDGIDWLSSERSEDDGEES